MSFLSKQQQHKKQINKCQNLQALLMALVLPLVFIATTLYPLEDYTVSGRKEDRGSKDVASHLNDVISTKCFKLAFSYFKAWYVTKWICSSANI
jgi:hypothetical protein